MNQNIDQSFIPHLRDRYADDEEARRFFDWVALRKNDAAETTIRRICQKTGITRPSAIRLMRALSDLGCGEFIVGRKGAESRMRWEVSLASLGKAAKGEAQDIDEVDPELAEDIADQQVPAGGIERGQEGPLTIAEAKQRLALALGVAPSSIEIIVRG